MVDAASVIYCGSFDAHIDEGMGLIQLLADLPIGVAWHTQAPQLGQVKTNYGIGKQTSNKQSSQYQILNIRTLSIASYDWGVFVISHYITLLQLKSDACIIGKYFLIKIRYFYIIITLQSCPTMTEPIKAMFRFSKIFQQSFKRIACMSARHLAYSDKYGSQYMGEYKKISSKMKKDQLKKSSKHKKKHKHEKDKLTKKLEQTKAKYMLKNKEKEKKRRYDNSDQSSGSEVSRSKQRRSRSRSRSRSKQRKRQRYYLDKIKQLEKNKQKEKHRSKHELIYEKKQQKKVDKEKYDNKQKSKRDQLDFQRDFDYKKPVKPTKKDYSIYEQPQSRRESEITKKKKISHKWSDKKPQSLGCQDADKYKILKMDQETSDFQDDEALQKVPMIKPREPLTPYFLFLRYNKRTISKGYPNIDIKTQLRGIWKNLSAEQKKPYEDEYERAQKVYAKKLTQYHAVNPKGAQQKNKIRKQIEEVTDRQKDQELNKKQGKGKKSKTKDIDSKPKRGKRKDGTGQTRRGRKKAQTGQNDSD